MKANTISAENLRIYIIFLQMSIEIYKSYFEQQILVLDIYFLWF